MLALMQVFLEVPLRPTPDEARRWLAQELAGRGYDRPVSWLERWIRDFLRRLTEQAMPDQLPNPTSVPVILLVVAVVGLLVHLIWRMRPEARRRREAAGTSALVDATLSAEDYRTRTATLLAARDFDQALICAYRAIVADMIRRTVLGRRPGDTAQEVARTIGLVFPDQFHDIHRAADLFDGAAYRQRTDAPTSDSPSADSPSADSPSADSPSADSLIPHSLGLRSLSTASDVRFVVGVDEALMAARPQHQRLAEGAA